MGWIVLAACAAACGRIDFASSDAAGGTSDGRAASDGGNGDGGGDAAAGTCGATVVFADDFGDGVVGSEWTELAASGLTVAETGGNLQITFASNVSAASVAGYRQTATMDYTGACTIAELVMAPSAATNAYAQVRVGVGANDNAQFEIAAGMMRSVLHAGSVIKMIDTRAWDPTAHRFLRIRELGGSWFWDVSPDGVTYTPLGTTTQVFGLETASFVQLVAGTNAAVNSGGQVQYASATVLARP